MEMKCDIWRLYIDAGRPHGFVKEWQGRAIG